MLLIAASPIATLVEIFFAVPLMIVAGIYGGEGASAYLHRRSRLKR